MPAKEAARQVRIDFGTTEAVIINMPARAYDYEQPDALDLPWDSDSARRIIPYVW